MDRLPCVLTIAGSDSGGGAGIQADLKTITMLGGYGASVITALTAQNTAAVTGIHAPSAKFVALQLKTVLDDIKVDAAKTGMLFSAPIIEALAVLLEKKTFPLVVDPVCVATSGGKLLQDDAVEAMVDRMFPLADLLTPNLPEAELFTGMKIESREDVFLAGKLLLKMGPKAVLIKGGHADSLAVTDWFMQPGEEPIPFMQRRVDTDCTHGTGCTLSAAIATGLARGLDLGAAILRAQEYLNLALHAGYRLGEGGGPPNHLAPWIKERARAGVLSSVDDLGRRMAARPGLRPMLPRRRANVAVAVPFADGLGDVAGFSGGFVSTVRGKVEIVGYPEFGASLRVASLLLSARRVRPELHCAMTLSGSSAVQMALGKLDAPIAWMDWEGRPEYITGEDGHFEEWGGLEALKGHAAPETVCALGDPGGMGREPILYVLAPDMEEMIAFLRRIADELAENPCEV
ncbi:bifunctional hydroxymethylpyrimidine kinase/phosphomethylpyrimidine kinase [uncultured Pseudodesulfovibrio sp.]|uniref:bifunctional hydroxymethylpyrimidine kinase/phosphomethylpyrimidine kinase n=1 Tax=uncultured Pseudodesulfovibrio sp. TaxID=2035858 RepID=UPI0029C72CB3|nr:bifunctional hydroxymethylpyrimidine kinase/phosphomethylpyrimidine kinase [uncultured Pseudodesulfovibrio sp.]